MSKEMPEGHTPSEQYLSRLCRRSFLSLWSYTNLHTDEGRKNEKDVGDELCDVLVIFGNDVVIFSDKYVEFNRSKDINVAWKRWFKKAILKSANQIYGAESWLRQHQNRIYIDRYCQKPFPIPLPSPERIKVHRVVVAHGIYHACAEYFGRRSLGSLIIHSGLEGDDHYLKPFHIGHINKKKGFVHVFEDFTLDSVLREQDTVQDFIAYLSKRKQLLSKEKPIVVATGDEQLLAVYLTNENSEGEHDFVLPDKEGDYVYFEEGSWESMVQHPQYVAKKKADQISYEWDSLIEYLIQYSNGDFPGQGPIPFSNSEQALRLMASEPRIRKRELADGLIGLLKCNTNNSAVGRLIYSSKFPDRAHLFLVCDPSDGQNYQEYRRKRAALLIAYCKVTKLLRPSANYIVGIATESLRKVETSFELVAIDAREWTSARQEEAVRLQKQYSLLLEPEITKKTERLYPEWPKATD